MTSLDIYILVSLEATGLLENKEAIRNFLLIEPFLRPFQAGSEWYKIIL
jgi:hypothetical protein